MSILRTGAMQRWFTLVVIMSFNPAAAVNAGQLLYLAAQRDKAVVAYHIDASSGELKPAFEVALPGSPGPLAFSPGRDFIYAEVSGLEDRKAGITTLAKSPDGTLSVKATSFIAGRSPYIRVDGSGRCLLAAHYGEGEVTTYRIADGLCTSEMLDRVVTDKTAHCVELDPSGRFVFVPHTSPNKVYQFRLDAETGRLHANDPPFVAGPDEDHLYHQPRHIAHHPTLSMAYTSNERGGGITAWKFDTDRGTLTRQQTLSTLPVDFEGNSAAADIQITPNGRFVYVSNRDVSKRADGEAARDSLAAFSINVESGELTRIGTYPTGKLPRSFCIDTSGRFLYAAGQGSANVTAYRIKGDTGALETVATYPTGEVPIWVFCADVE